MLLIIVVFGLYNIFIGELVPTNGGLGWDGVTYGNITKNVTTLIGNREFDSYYAHRFLPSAIVRVVLEINKIPLSDKNIVKCFQVYNLIIVIAVLFFLLKIFKKINVSESSKWVGFFTMFFSFECSKQFYYDPVLTDSTALLIGILLLFFYIERKLVCLLILSIIGSMSWQLTSVCVAVAILFIDTKFIIRDKKLVNSHLINIFKIITFITVASYLYTKIAKNSYNIYFGKIITGLPSITILTFGLVNLLWLGKLTDFKCKINIKKVLCAIAALIIPNLISKYLSQHGNVLSYTNEQLIGLFIPPYREFFLPFVTLASYWGPMIIFVFIYWGVFCNKVKSLGVGYVLIIAINIILSLDCEPRFITLGWPFIVVGGVLAMDAIKPTTQYKYLFILCTILASCCWLKINSPSWSPVAEADLFILPKQLFFMHYGQWTHHYYYRIELAIFLILGITSFIFCNPLKLKDCSSEYPIK